MISVVLTCDTFGNDFLIKYRFAKYLKESCILSCDKHLSFKKVKLTSVVWSCNTFGNNFLIKRRFERYLKESCT